MFVSHAETVTDVSDMWIQSIFLKSKQMLEQFSEQLKISYKIW